MKNFLHQLFSQSINYEAPYNTEFKGVRRMAVLIKGAKKKRSEIRMA